MTEPNATISIDHETGPEQEIIFSERDGYILASWPGTNASVRLGRRETVAAMMKDFLEQAALGERLGRSQ
jgi:hypothetical protein